MMKSIIDTIVTKYYQLYEKIHVFMWKCKITEKIPGCELDLTSLLDEADKEVKHRDRFNGVKF